MLLALLLHLASAQTGPYAYESSLVVLDRSRNKECAAALRIAPTKPGSSTLVALIHHADTGAPLNARAVRFDSLGDAPETTGFTAHNGVVVVPLLEGETAILFEMDGFLPQKIRFGPGEFCVEVRLAARRK